MKEEFVSYSQAVALKECGFDWKCQRYYIKVNETDVEPSMIKASYSPENWNDGRHSDPPFAKPLCSAPTLALAQKWLREVKGWHIQVRINGVRDMFSVEIWEMRMNGYFNRLEQSDGHVRLFDTYESALSAGLDAALELIKQK